MAYFTALVKFRSISYGKEFTTIMAFCMFLASAALEAVSLICTLEANWG